MFFPAAVVLHWERGAVCLPLTALGRGLSRLGPPPPLRRRCTRWSPRARLRGPAFGDAGWTRAVLASLSTRPPPHAPTGWGSWPFLRGCDSVGRASRCGCAPPPPPARPTRRAWPHRRSLPLQEARLSLSRRVQARARGVDACTGCAWRCGWGPRRSSPRHVGPRFIRVLPCCPPAPLSFWGPARCTARQEGGDVGGRPLPSAVGVGAHAHRGRSSFVVDLSLFARSTSCR